MTSDRVFRVPRIKCEGCAETIGKALAGVAGVTATRVVVADRQVHVQFDERQVDEGRIRRVLGEVGFPPA